MPKVPVVIFTYNRPAATKALLQIVASYDPPVLYLVADGPRRGDTEDNRLVRENIDLLHSYSGGSDCRFVISQENLGLRRRFQTALDQVFQEVPSAIILEDDCHVGSAFFRFAEWALREFSLDKSIGTISAHNPAPWPLPFCRLSQVPRIWGWATWADRWTTNRSLPARLFRGEPELAASINLIRGRSSRYLLKRLTEGTIASRTWDVEFALNEVQLQRYCLLPPSNLVENLGQVIPGTHRQDWAHLEVPKIGRMPERMPLVLSGISVRATDFYEDIFRVVRYLLAILTSPGKSFRWLRRELNVRN